MTKVLNCGDVEPGCNVKIRGKTERDVLREAADHAKTAHGMESIPPEVLSKIKGAIRDEDQARAQKVGSTS
jgi:predicted small metal-binding protein